LTVANGMPSWQTFASAGSRFRLNPACRVGTCPRLPLFV
jgi:hypothetical protein